jgi:hypothetical protein
VKHDYFIEDLGQPRGWFKAHRYRYTCLRCGWAFLVENWKGKVSAVGEADQTLSNAENFLRVSTFTDGPCHPDSAKDPRRQRQAVVNSPPARPRKAMRRADGITQIMSAK